MKTHQPTASRAFTLIELLVVITIIAILTSLVTNQITQAINEAHRLKVRAVINDLKNGIETYQLDYGRYPLDSNASGANGEDVTELLTDGSNAMVDGLMGIPPATSSGGTMNLNPKNIQFSQFQPANNGRHGFVGASRPYRLNDMWGQPYHILLDTNGDNQVKNPDAANTDPKISQNQASHLPIKAAVFSSGKDQTPRTGDDITSWRPK